MFVPKPRSAIIPMIMKLTILTPVYNDWESAFTLITKIDQVLSDDAMRNRVTRMQNEFLAYDLENSAVKAVESLL